LFQKQWRLSLPILDVVPAVYPSDIRDYYDPERKQLFVFDDMCGKYSIHVQTMLDWKDSSKKRPYITRRMPTIKLA
jgi:hypothetical protein